MSLLLLYWSSWEVHGVGFSHQCLLFFHQLLISPLHLENQAQCPWVKNHWWTMWMCDCGIFWTQHLPYWCSRTRMLWKCAWLQRIPCIAMSLEGSFWYLASRNLIWMGSCFCWDSLQVGLLWWDLAYLQQFWAVYCSGWWLPCHFLRT